jgi:hypothetical protein
MTSCTKKSELEPLDAESNFFYSPEETYNNYFIFDSTYSSQYPYVQLYYHLNPEVPVASIYKIYIYRDGEIRFKLLPSQVNAFNPRDLNVSRFHTYNYTFAIAESDETITKVSLPLTVTVH